MPMPDQIDEAPFLRHSSPRTTFPSTLHKTFSFPYPVQHPLQRVACCIFSAFHTPPINDVHFEVEHLQEILTYPFKPLPYVVVGQVLARLRTSTVAPTDVDNHWSVSADGRATKMH